MFLISEGLVSGPSLPTTSLSTTLTSNNPTTYSHTYRRNDRLLPLVYSLPSLHNCLYCREGNAALYHYVKLIVMKSCGMMGYMSFHTQAIRTHVISSASYFGYIPIGPQEFSTQDYFGLRLIHPQDLSSSGVLATKVYLSVNCDYKQTKTRQHSPSHTQKKITHT